MCVCVCMRVCVSFSSCLSLLPSVRIAEFKCHWAVKSSPNSISKVIGAKVPYLQGVYPQTLKWQRTFSTHWFVTPSSPSFSFPALSLRVKHVWCEAFFFFFHAALLLKFPPPSGETKDWIHAVALCRHESRPLVPRQRGSTGKLLFNFFKGVTEKVFLNNNNKKEKVPRPVSG